MAESVELFAFYEDCGGVHAFPDTLHYDGHGYTNTLCFIGVPESAVQVGEDSSVTCPECLRLCLAS